MYALDIMKIVKARLFDSRNFCKIMQSRDIVYYENMLMSYRSSLKRRCQNSCSVSVSGSRNNPENLYNKSEVFKADEECQPTSKSQTVRKRIYQCQELENY